MENGVRTLGNPWEHKKHGEQHRVGAGGCVNIEKLIAALAPGRRRLRWWPSRAAGWSCAFCTIAWHSGGYKWPTLNGWPMTGLPQVIR